MGRPAPLAASWPPNRPCQTLNFRHNRGMTSGAPLSTGRVSKITVPEHCDPRAKFVFAEMQRQGVTYDSLEWKSGVLRTTFKAWRTNNKPGLDTLEAALGALGWTLLPCPQASNIPAALRADLEEVATKHALSDMPLLDLIAACADRGWRENMRARRAA